MKEDKDNFTFPYRFVRRAKGNRRAPVVHNELLEGNYDVAFEVTWEVLTPCALNPCVDQNIMPSLLHYAKVEKEKNAQEEKKYMGYNRRWLVYDGHFVISPFTVKSAIANGFANLMGGCYRVNTKIESHKKLEKGEFPYSGVYKRYRVARDGSSKPGIIESINLLPSGDREVIIQPVKEFYLDDAQKLLGQNPKFGEEYYVTVRHRDKEPPIIENIKKNPTQAGGGWIKVKYLGPMNYGMEQKSHSRHKHRFFIEAGEKIRGRIPAVYFLSKEDLKKIVTLGGVDPKGNQVEYYQDLRDIKVGSFVYFEVFANNTIHIGKNFLFKAIFHHEDAVPEDQLECKSVESLCPRCSMFGMTEKEINVEEKGRRPVGYKGRFRASALVSDVKFETEVVEERRFRFLDFPVEMRKWIDAKGNVLARQILLPIMGPPKPNKRDVDGYYIKAKNYDTREAGLIKGAKVYRHGFLKDAETLERLGNESTNFEGKEPRHDLRSFAQVLERGVRFAGTVGAENCREEEIAAFLLLLNSSYSGHYFKIGLGKAYGMGSFSSRVNKIWIRRRGNYDEWEVIDVSGMKEEELLAKLDTKTKEAYVRLKKIESAFNKREETKLPRLNYPKAGTHYWTDAKKYGFR